jgi:hypothetical protein
MPRTVVIAGKFVRDRPARRAGDEAEPTLLRKVVDLVHDAVDLVREPVTLGADLPKIAQAAVDRGDHAGLWANPEPEPAQRLEQFALAFGQRSAVDLADPVDEEIERPRSAHRRIELAQRPRRGVARIDERLLAPRGGLLVQAAESGERHVRLAAHFEQARRRPGVQPQRQRTDRAQVRGDVLPLLAIAARRRTGVHAVHVGRVHREAVELRLDGIRHRRRLPESLAHASIEIPHLLVAERVVEGKHRQPMPHFRESGDRGRPDPLCRRIRGDERGVLGLQRLQLAQPLVVLGIRHLRIVERVVAIVVPVDQPAELRGVPGGRFGCLRCARAHRP